ncbi:hypothetical protein JA1_005261 [Spathaspora sp. JA1]|nr:hypothetical protein JA1_005261 [Spathaspora sp. JA1]
MTDQPSSNYYFLLKTENIQPLLETVQQLQNEITKNHKIINQLTSIIDYKLNSYPELTIEQDVLKLAEGCASEVATTSSQPRELYSMNEQEEEEEQEEKTETSSDDPLRYLLTQKYNLPPESPNNTKVQQLLADISYLTKLKQGKKSVNFQSMEIIQSYESFIMIGLLPQLRTQLESYNHRINSIKTMINMKYVYINQIYEKYLNNVEELCKVVDLNHALIDFIKEEDKVNLKLSQQLASLQHLQLTER